MFLASSPSFWFFFSQLAAVFSTDERNFRMRISNAGDVCRRPVGDIPAVALFARAFGVDVREMADIASPWDLA